MAPIFRRTALSLLCAAALVCAACGDDEVNDSNNAGTNNGATNNGGTNNGATNNGGTNNGGTNNGGTNNGGTNNAGTNNGTAQTLDIPGLSAGVNAEIDAQGVLHLDCQTDADCYAAQGYFHARERFVQMDVRRRFARGKLATLIGAPITDQILDNDRTARLLFTTRDGEPLEEAFLEESDPYTVAALEAYASGVNAWLDDLRAGRNGAKLSKEYDFGFVQATPETIPDWEPLDSVSAILLLLDSLSNSSGSDLAFGEIYASLDPETAFDLAGVMSAVDSATMPASGEAYGGLSNVILPPMAGLQQLQAMHERLQPAKVAMSEARARMEGFRSLGQGLGLTNVGEVGSNNWVMGPARTQSGHGILANDPHLSLSQPALWHLSELDSKTNGEGSLHVAGVSFPGLPGITLGHNEDIAWGATVVYYDLADVYVEELNEAGDAVILDGNEVPLVQKTYEFDVVGQDEPVTETFEFVPHHGPILSKDLDAGTAISLRWTGNDARTDLNLFFDVMRASTVDEARQGFTWSTSANQNWIVVDTNDDIGWFPYNAVPKRPWASLDLAPWIPLPGDGSAEWGGTIPLEEQPQMTNPSEGFIATANQDATGAKYDGDPTSGHIYLQGHTAMGIRHARIVDMIEEGGTDHTVESNLAIQADDYMLLAELVLPTVQEVVSTHSAELDAQQTAFWSQLEGWDYTCPTGVDGITPDAPASTDADELASARGCTAFHYLLAHLADATFSDEVAGTGLAGDSSSLLRSLVVLIQRPEDLMAGEDYWNDTTTNGAPESRDDTILAGLASASAAIAGDLGQDPEGWLWGRVHTLTLRPDLFSLFGSLWDNGPFAAPGGALTVNVANPRGSLSGNFSFSAGPSMRLLAWNDGSGIRAKMTFPGGNSMHDDSPFYDNLMEGWIKAEPFELLFERDEVSAAAVETVEVQPAP